MAKSDLRKIIVDGENYLWRFTPGYEKTGDAANPYQCHDIFSAYLKGYKTSPLQVHFITWEDVVIGGPLRVGAPVILDNPNSVRLNLHTPKAAAEIIRCALKIGWQPTTSKKLFLLEDGVSLLSQVWDNVG